MARKEKKSEPTVGTTLRLDISTASAPAILRSIRAVDAQAADTFDDNDFPLQAIKDYATTPAYKTVNGRRVKARDPLADSLEDYLKGFLRVGKVRWVTVLDANTAPLDRSLNGTIWDADDPAAPIPPNHVNCRCLRQPIPGPAYR